MELRRHPFHCTARTQSIHSKRSAIARSSFTQCTFANSTTMIRKITAITLLVSWIALASSGMLMLWMDQPSFTLRMHPVHKLFGVLLVIAVSVHIMLNRRALAAHLSTRAGWTTAVTLGVVLAITYTIVAFSHVPEELARPLDEAARLIEAQQTSPPQRPPVSP